MSGITFLRGELNKLCQICFATWFNRIQIKVNFECWCLAIYYLKHLESIEFSDFLTKNGSFIPKFTSIYNFETKSWIGQDPLDFTMKGDLEFEFDYNPACAIEQRKNDSRWGLFF